jgi:ABC-2 type transport system permease protein
MLKNTRLQSLILKEFRQAFRDRQLLSLLLVLPVVQVCLYGFALDPEVRHLPLGVVDMAKTHTSRELISALVENQTFTLAHSSNTVQGLYNRVRNGELQVGLVIPPEFERRIKNSTGADVQAVLDAVDANTAGIAANYLKQMVSVYDAKLPPAGHSPPSPIVVDVDFIYNPGLKSAWFFVPGVLGLALTVAGTMVAASILIREKDSGTLEQLLMTPVSAMEILIAKIVPLLVLLSLNVLVGITLSMTVFQVPFRGHVLDLAVISLLAMFVIIALGTFIATVSANQRQALLTSFFIILPVFQFAGTITPLESMPSWARALSSFDPLRYYIDCLRAILLKGVGLDVLWPNALALLIFAILLLASGSYRFRRQLE